MADLSPVSGVLTASTSSSSVVSAAAPLWNNLLDLSGLKPTANGNDLVVVGHSSSVNSTVGSSGNNTILSSTASSSICSSNNNNNNNNSSSSGNNEDSYEAGIADDMRELVLRLESELELDENGV